MRVFVTGATGFIGAHLVKELLSTGHEVLGLARSEASAQALLAAGAKAHHGTLEDLDSLRRGAADADATVHLAFIHDFANFKANSRLDQQAIEAIGSVLAGSDRPFLVTTGTAGLAGSGPVADEDAVVSPDFPSPRISEQTADALLSKGVRAAVVRLPQVHNAIKQGLVSYLIAVAREKGVSAYLGEGNNRWAAAHVVDVARLYRLALEGHEAGAKYHAVAEEGVAMRDIAETIGRGLETPVVSLSPEDATAHFGWLSLFVGQDLQASSAKTRGKLGWTPTKPGLIADLEAMDYS
jgi:nucleoside-diphosphate-sugar epimerase